jgi:hypothetical protein
MFSKLFGKWASVVSAVAMLIVAVVKVLKPEWLSTDAAIAILTALGVHASTADSSVKPA